MSSKLESVRVYDIKDNVFKLIADDWMLVTAGTIEAFNTMTASWGTLGELWNRKIAVCFVRPSRYTYQFMEREDAFTLSFFDEKYRDALNYCGTRSGRDLDKMADTGLSPVTSPHGTVYFEQARLVLVCRKIYIQDLDPAKFLDPNIEKQYPKKDYHRMYIGEIMETLSRR